MRWRSAGILLAALVAVVIGACVARGSRGTQEELRQQVMETERAFAATMAARDFGVTVIPGRFFGAPAHVRLSLAGPAANLRGGLAQLSRALAAR